MNLNQQLWSGLTTAALLLASLSTASAGSAEQTPSPDDTFDSNVSLTEETSEPTEPVSTASSLTAVAAPAPAPEDAVKVGEYRSQDQPEAFEETIALIQPHEMQGRSAATLYVRNIPVLTFLGASPAEATAEAPADVKVASTDEPTSEPAIIQTSTSTSSPEATRSPEANSTDPAWRATSVAAQLNQLYRDRMDAEAITVHWNSDRARYVIKVNDQELVEINPDTVLPDTTNDAANDALQATNRLRRLMGDAPPLQAIAGRPAPQPQAISLSSVQRTLRGMASWYGPGFNGNRSANGEIFNQNALTAAHRNLPFGTQVRVTNLQNGQSVVVRITDRGPYSGRRIIDLSAAAARAVGMLQAGVAPVSLDILGAANAIADRRN